MAVNYSVAPRKIRLLKDENGNVSFNTSADKAEVRFYAYPQVGSVMTFEQFAEHVVSHDSKYHKGDVLAVVVEVMRCLKEQLLNGKRVQLSDLGVFSLKLSGPGAPSMTDFNTQTNITTIEVRWTPGKNFRDLRHDEDLVLNQVLTKEEDAEIKKAKKAASPSVKGESPSGSDVPGGTTTDNSQQTTDNGQNPSGGNPSGGQQTTDNGQQSGGDPDDSGLV